MKKDINEIISKSLGGLKLDKEERQLMDSWMDMDGNKRFYNKMEAFASQAKGTVNDPHMNVDKAYQKHLNKLKKAGSVRRIQLYKKVLPYAAMFVLLAGVASLMYFFGGGNAFVSEEDHWLANFEPGSQKAELVMADGKVLNLDEKRKDKKIKEKDGTLIQNTGSSLVYNENTKSVEKAIHYNSLVVPRGGEYQLELADGTKVYVNSESRLRYPTQFSEDERIVLLEGEAYFDVSKDQNRPFIVKTQGVDVRVLGTEFNVSSYNDEDEICTTLVEGSVVVMDSKDQVKNVILKPGYQAVYAKSEKDLDSEKVNTDLYTSWKDGKFMFERSQLSDIMNKVSRWYDVKVFYQSSDVETINFTGTLKRYDNLERLLGMIEKTNEVKFVVRENTIVVEKKY